MVVELRVVQFWSEIILVISKSRGWYQMGLHSSRLNYHYLSLVYSKRKGLKQDWFENFHFFSVEQ